MRAARERGSYFKQQVQQVEWRCSELRADSRGGARGQRWQCEGYLRERECDNVHWPGQRAYRPGGRGARQAMRDRETHADGGESAVLNVSCTVEARTTGELVHTCTRCCERA